MLRIGWTRTLCDRSRVFVHNLNLGIADIVELWLHPLRLTLFRVSQSVCVDKVKVCAEHKYDTKVFSDKAVRDVKQTLKNIRNHLHDELTLYAYEAHLSR